MQQFTMVLWHYIVVILPALAIGFFLSGIVHELVPESLVQRHLGKKGFLPVFYATFIGALLPICCWGALPVAVSFHKKGSRLGPVLAFLVATPATSISALAVTYKLLGMKFAVYIFFSVIFMGMAMGAIGNRLKIKPVSAKVKEPVACPRCEFEGNHKEGHAHSHKKGLIQRAYSILKYSFWDMPKEIGLETFIGIVLAAAVATIVPVGLWVQHNLAGAFGYVFSVIFGLVMYICSTASVPFVDALLGKGMSQGAAMVLLLVGPITSFGTMLVLKKEFGIRILFIYLAAISISSLILGYIFSII